MRENIEYHHEFCPHCKKKFSSSGDVLGRQIIAKNLDHHIRKVHPDVRR